MLKFFKGLALSLGLVVLASCSVLEAAPSGALNPVPARPSISPTLVPEAPFKTLSEFSGKVTGSAIGSCSTSKGNAEAFLLGLQGPTETTSYRAYVIFELTGTSRVLLVEFDSQDNVVRLWFMLGDKDGNLTLVKTEKYDSKKHVGPCEDWLSQADA